MLVKNSGRILPRLKNLFTKKTCDGLKLQTPMMATRNFYDRRPDPFTQMENFMKDMEKRFWDVNRSFPWISSFPRLVDAASDSAVTPFKTSKSMSGPANLSTQDKFKLAFKFPNAKPEDIKVTLKDRLLTIEAKVNEETEHTKMHQSLNYEYSVPESVDIEALESLFTTDGVLTIEAPKTPEEAPRTINIKRE